MDAEIAKAVLGRDREVVEVEPARVALPDVQVKAHLPGRKAVKALGPDVGHEAAPVRPFALVLPFIPGLVFGRRGGPGRGPSGLGCALASRLSSFIALATSYSWKIFGCILYVTPPDFGRLTVAFQIVEKVERGAAEFVGRALVPAKGVDRHAVPL